MYSFVFCYRDREEHAKLVLPRIKAVCAAQNIEFELIVVEQHDDLKFRRGNLFNEGTRWAKGDVLILHDIDHYPTDNVVYYDGVSDMYLPIAKVRYVDANLMEKLDELVPPGYRHFKNGVDSNYYGGVEVFKRDAFFRINGFCPFFVGWGVEDADLRERIVHNKLSVARSATNEFFALDHADNCPPSSDPDFQNNARLGGLWETNQHHGVNNQKCQSEEVEPKFGATRWIRATEFENEPPQSLGLIQYTQIPEVSFDE